VAGLGRGTGHGTAWSGLLAALAGRDEVRLVSRGRADVWIASGHDEPPDAEPLVVQVFEAPWADPALRDLMHPAFASEIAAATGAAIRAANRVVTTSAASRVQILHACDVAPDRVHVVPLGVDRTLFAPGLPWARETIGAPYVLFVGLLHPRKNYVAVRRAVAGLAQAGLPHVLVIVGAPPPDPDALRFEREATAELDGHPGRIRTLRSLADERLAALMAGADVLCLPSWFEGFGLPVLEAMSCGAPVVVSDRGALPEVVGDAGLVVSPDPEAVVHAVRDVVTDSQLSARLRRAGPLRAAQFSWERTAAGWLEVLQRAASTRG
jgi:glycosyltransferase involved in cell wall biosynthesis